MIVSIQMFQVVYAISLEQVNQFLRIHSQVEIQIWHVQGAKQGYDFLRAIVAGAMKLSTFWFVGALDEGPRAGKPHNDPRPSGAQKFKIGAT